ncbi:MAG: zinc ribbon domain-containing protein [Gemmatimonadales bacterium]
MFELLIGLALALVALVLVLEPMLRGHRAQAPVLPQFDWSDLDESDTPKVRALMTLQEVEFDRETGKLSAEDYQLLKSRYSAQAVAAMDAEKRAEQVTAPGGDAAEELIARVRLSSGGYCPLCEATLEMGAVFCSACGCAVNAESPTARCRTCGDPIPVGAKFCNACGASQPEEKLPV